MKKPKKYSYNQRLLRIEKAIGEIYMMIHHIADKLEPEDKTEEE
jgi:hypothetical protein